MLGDGIQYPKSQIVSQSEVRVKVFFALQAVNLVWHPLSGLGVGCLDETCRGREFSVET